MKEKHAKILVTSLLIGLNIPLVLGIAYGIKSQIKENKFKARQAIVQDNK